MLGGRIRVTALWSGYAVHSTEYRQVQVFDTECGAIRRRAPRTYGTARRRTASGVKASLHLHDFLTAIRRAVARCYTQYSQRPDVSLSSARIY